MSASAHAHSQMKHPVLLLLLLLSPCFVTSQATYQKLISSTASGLGGVALAEAPDGGFVVGGVSGQIIKLDAQGVVEWGRQLDSAAVFDVDLSPSGDIFLSINNNDAQALLSVDAGGQMNWTVYTGKPNFSNGQVAVSSAGIVTVSRREVIEKPFNIQQWNFDGNLDWMLKIELPDDTLTGISVADYLGGSWLAAAYNSTGTYLFRISHDGNPFWYWHIAGLWVKDLGVYSNGQLFAAGSFPGSNDVVMLRFKHDGSIIWQKRLQSLIQNTGVATLGTNGDVLVRTYMGNGLAGLIKIDESGDMQWARGYPSGNFGMSRPIFTSDGGVAMLVPKPNQTSLAEIVLIKADAEGYVEGCEVLDICPQYEDVQLDISAFEFSSELIPFFGNIAVELFSLPLDITPFCQPVQLPLPDFDIVDTVCAGSHAMPTPLMNDGAQAWEWEFGPGAVPPVSSEQFPGNVLFTQPGAHTVRQTVVFGGCRDSFEQVVNVLPAPIPDLGPDTLICEDVMYQLDGSLPGDVSYLWENGSSDPVRTVSQNGTYVLTATDELCSGVDSVKVRFFGQTWPDAALQLPGDTLACEEQALLIDAAIPGATAWQWSTGADTAAIFIDEPGQYSLTAYFEHCPLMASFTVDFASCSAKIYLPNAFSPNNDGINDLLIPFGNNAILENMKIFNRWGGMVYETDHPDTGWDGTVKGKAAATGVYVVLIKYLDEYTGEEKWYSGEVVLVRN